MNNLITKDELDKHISHIENVLNKQIYTEKTKKLYEDLEFILKDYKYKIFEPERKSKTGDDYFRFYLEIILDNVYMTLVTLTEEYKINEQTLKMIEDNEDPNPLYNKTLVEALKYSINEIREPVDSLVEILNIIGTELNDLERF